MSVVKPNPVQIEAAKDLLYVPGRTELALSVQREAIRDVARMTRISFATAKQPYSLILVQLLQHRLVFGASY
jgi:hypothetical protein